MLWSKVAAYILVCRVYTGLMNPIPGSSADRRDLSLRLHALGFGPGRQQRLGSPSRQ